MSEEKKCSECSHPQSAHKYEDGFYDVRGHYADCGYVSCSCEKYR